MVYASSPTQQQRQLARVSIYTDKIAAFENDYNDAELDDEQVMEKLDMQLLERLIKETEPIFFFIKQETQRDTFDLFTDRVMQEDFPVFFELADE
jgi:iron-sulfur cluster repair protein YtfE (RIC family)